MSAERLLDAPPTIRHPVFVTRDGLLKLEAELDDLEHMRRNEIADRLRAAREFGNGLENTELLEAKEEVWRLERQICDVKALLGESELIESAPSPRGEVRVGSRVVVSSEFGREEFVIVGSVEADPTWSRISNESPLGSALIGRRAGDRIEWKSPDGRCCAVVDRVT